MSSLAAARADNFYYPPDWDPSKESLSQHTGDTKGRNQFEQLGVIRFELPYDGWCLGCSRHVGKGVRFNAKKDAAGKYHSTTIWAFTMQCPSCTQQFVIKTDPKSTDYDFSAGIRRKVEEYEENAEDGARAMADLDHRVQAEELLKKADPINRMERQQDDRAKAAKHETEVGALHARGETMWAQDVDANQLLRRRARTDRKAALARDAKASALGLTCGLLAPTAADTHLARSVRFRPVAPAVDAARRRVAASSIFGGATTKAVMAAQTAERRGIGHLRLAPPRA
eukprot:CAMPEP_0184195396 /NCGR_PEP_ID=MMETSP0976-20121227/4976_1 /TAXON_ID=483370 /ORGANISM="non described non described, Strain CCMP2097" /LENGTH=283 /DNA_ID=CAMNT_0026499835 /DNA_START=364 /DNA_END=1212 /DNA_ORIENTATION=-